MSIREALDTAHEPPRCYPVVTLAFSPSDSAREGRARSLADRAAGGMQNLSKVRIKRPANDHKQAQDGTARTTPRALHKPQFGRKGQSGEHALPVGFERSLKMTLHKPNMRKLPQAHQRTGAGGKAHLNQSRKVGRAIIFLTSLTLAGYPWGDVTGRDYGRNPTATINTCGGISTLRVTCDEIFSRINSVATAEATVGSSSVSDSSRTMDEKYSVTPSGVSSLGGNCACCSSSHPDSINNSRNCVTNESFSATLEGEPPRSPQYVAKRCPENCFRELTKESASSLLNVRLTVRLLSSVSNLTRARLASAVACSAFLDRSTLSAIRSSASSSALLAANKARRLNRTSPPTPNATIRFPITARCGHLWCMALYANSGPVSISNPAKTRTPAPNAQRSNLSARRPNLLVSFLVGPLIGFRRKKPSRVGAFGVIIVFALFLLYVLSCVFCQGHSDCPSWLNVRLLLEQGHRACPSEQTGLLA